MTRGGAVRRRRVLAAVGGLGALAAGATTGVESATDASGGEGPPTTRRLSR